jgi:hypothetical protein
MAVGVAAKVGRTIIRSEPRSLATVATRSEIDCDRAELLAVLRKKGGSIMVFGDEGPDGSAVTSGVEVPVGCSAKEMNRLRKILRDLADFAIHH